jgi:hypothetical protein
MADSSWPTVILSDLDEETAAKTLRAVRTEGGQAETYHIGLLRCPDDRTTTGIPDSDLNESGKFSYAANAGVPDRWRSGTVLNPDVRANGVFHCLSPTYGIKDERLRTSWIPRLRMGNAYISRHDGTSHTILVSENVDATQWWLLREYSSCILWDADKESRRSLQRPPQFDLGGEMAWEADAPYGINVERAKRPGDVDTDGNPVPPMVQQSTRWCRPSSYHQGGGVNVVFSDGSGRFLSEELPYEVYVQLMTPHGAAAMIDVHHKILAPPEFSQPLPNDS